MKNLITILFLSIGFHAFAQNPITTPRIKITDRTGIDTTTVSNQGQIVFDGTDDKLRFNDGNGWFSFLKEGASFNFWPLSGTEALTGDVNIQGASTHDVAIGTTGSRVADFKINTSEAVTINRQISTDGSRSTIRMDADLLGILRGNYLGDTPEQRIQAEGDSLYIFVGQGTLSDNFLRLVFRPDSGLLYEDSTANNYGIRYGGVITPTDSTLITKAYVDGKFDGIEVPEGANKTMGIATLSSGTITVNTTAVTATSRIFLTVNGGTLTNVGTPYVSARVASTSFTITSTNASDASDVAWIIIEPF